MTDAGPYVLTGYWAKEYARVQAENETLKAELNIVGSTRDILRAALAEITDLELEGDASLADAMHIADEALNPSA